MADGGPPLPPVKPPLVVPLQQPDDAEVQVVLPGHYVMPPIPQTQPGPVPLLNWSHFKPKFAVKQDDDVEAHLLKTNNWMDAHAF